jgi:uncharacterized membrane protein YphA (DoxX/SURF4 family)
VGVLLAFHGYFKITHGVDWIAGPLGRVGLPPWVAYGTYAAEVLAPILLIVGLFVRPAALVIAFDMFIAIFLARRADVSKINPMGGGWAIELELLLLVAALNMDMIGRGGADDIPGGSPDFLGVVGANFISNDIGDAVRSVNARQGKPLVLDYRFDADVTGSLGPAYNNIYRRSDHYMYAQAGIPIAFFFTGLHADYHQVTDEPQYIDYTHYNRITNYVRDLAVELANRDKRPAANKPVP